MTMSPQALVSFTIPHITPIQFLHHFWIQNETFFQQFLSQELQNENIKMQNWQYILPSSSFTSTQDDSSTSMIMRHVESLHPITSKQAYLKLILGFLPNFAISKKKQYIVMSPSIPTTSAISASSIPSISSIGPHSYSILEEAKFENLPFCEYFEVHTKWTLQEDHHNPLDDTSSAPTIASTVDIQQTLSSSHSMDITGSVDNQGKKKKWWQSWKDQFAASNNFLPSSSASCTTQTSPQNKGTKVAIYVDMHFIKPMLLKELLRSNTLKELKEVLESWGQAALKDVQALGPLIHHIPSHAIDQLTFQPSSNNQLQHHQAVKHVGNDEKRSIDASKASNNLWDKLMSWKKDKK